MSFEHALGVGAFWAAIPLAALAGILAGLNPCCLPLYPAVAASCCVDVSEPRSRSLSRVLALVLGTVLATTALGIAAALAGHALAPSRAWRYALAFVPMLAGLYVLGGFGVRRGPVVDGKRRGALATFALGLALAGFLGTCSTPILASILSYVAYKANATLGASLLFSYGLGSAVPLLALGIGLGTALRRPALARAQQLLDRLAGITLVAVGFYLLWRA